MKRWSRAMVPVMVLGLAVVLAACGDSTDSVDEVRENIEQVKSLLGDGVLPLPAITIDVATDGRIDRIAGFDAEAVDDLAERFTGLPLVGSVIQLDTAYLRWFDRADIQHVTLASRPEGLFLLVNGKAMPYLAWDGASVDTLVEVLGDFQKETGSGAYLVTPDAYDVVRSALPFLQSLGLRFDVRFPDMDGSGRVPVPLAGDEAFSLALTDEEVDAPPLQSVDLEIEYRELADGRGWVPALFGLSTIDLNAVGEPFEVTVPQMRLREDIRRRLAAKAIGTIGLEARADGLFFAVDGRLLPHLAWSEATLTHLAEALDRLYPEGTKLPEDAEWVPVVRSTAPMYNDFSIALLARFPVTEP